MGILRSIFGSSNDRQINKIKKIVDKVNALEPSMQALSDKELRQKTDEFKQRVADGESLDSIMPEAFAAVREGSVRSLGMRHYDVQLIGGAVLHEGRIAEMKTGEGKTLVATLPTYLNALTGEGVHVVTVNDYLAKRDMEWMGKLYNFMGLKVGCVIHGLDDEERREAYNCDITYGTNNEFGFDYLRDNMAIYMESRVQRVLNYAIVDEVDSILVDEARTPLIISGEGTKSTELYQKADSFAKNLTGETDFVIDEKQKTINLTEESGVAKAESYFNIENLSDLANMEISHHINQALRARFIMKRDVDYVVQDNEILIVDEFTGRLMEGRRYSNGLHQAIEAKEKLKVMRESQTLATVTLQNYFRMYKKIAGMTGTAKTEEDEFKHIYNMDVVQIPTNKDVIRKDLNDIIFKTSMGRYNAVIEDIIECHEKGQPVLVGTISIENSELLSSLLKKRGIKHEVLNAKQHDREAEIVAQAGRFGSVTIATNMAGRGTDILLGGNPDFMTKREMAKLGYDEYLISLSTSPLDFEDEEIVEAKARYQDIYKGFKVETDAEASKVIEAGGLHIIGTERHESRRIDNQLRGRSGRQGDPGSTRFYLSFEDDLLRIFVTEKVKNMVSNLGMDENTPLEAGMLTKQIEAAQKKVEGRNFAIRKHVLQYDDVMNRQREIIYGERYKVLSGENIKENVIGMIENLIEDNVTLYTAEGNYPEEWDMKGLEDSLYQLFLPKKYFTSMGEKELHEFTREGLLKHLKELALELYDKKEAEFGEDMMREVERYVMLKVVDSKWIEHIDAMDDFKEGVNLRAYGNEDPVRAYQIEGFDMFNEMTKNIQIDTVKAVYHAALDSNLEREDSVRITGESSADESKIGGFRADPSMAEEYNGGNYRSEEGAPEKMTPVKREVTVGRNEPCPCGSGKKYKHCCGRN